jgi:hypothetical protein
MLTKVFNNEILDSERNLIKSNRFKDNHLLETC